jgi:hypothetical protein
MLRTNRFVLGMALATLAIALPSAVQARQKIPTNMTRDCLTPQGTTLQHGTSHIVIDDESCATAEYWCNNATLCYVIKWDAVCGDQDFGAPQTRSECYQSPAPSRLVSTVPSATLTTTTTPTPTTSTTPTTSLIPSGTLSSWY